MMTKAAMKKLTRQAVAEVSGRAIINEGAVMGLWRLGLDTFDIARIIKKSESDVANAVAAARDAEVGGDENADSRKQASEDPRQDRALLRTIHLGERQRSIDLVAAQAD